MSAHLQRLYDGAAAASTAIDARPAQRSSSPLLAVDQRLAVSTYAASFLIGVPGDAETLPESETWPGLPTDLRPASEPAVPVPLSVPQPLTTPADHGPPTDSVARTERPYVWDSSLNDRPRPVNESVPTRPVSRDSEQTATTIPSEAPRRNPRTPRPRVAAVPEPARAAAPRPDAPELLHPLPPAPAPPLPPPVPNRETDLTEQVRRLVHEAMANHRTQTPARAREPEPDPVPTTSGSTGRPTTAEAASLIGPLDRPARAITLYGLRLR